MSNSIKPDWILAAEGNIEALKKRINIDPAAILWAAKENRIKIIKLLLLAYDDVVLPNYPFLWEDIIKDSSKEIKKLLMIEEVYNG